MIYVLLSVGAKIRQTNGCVMKKFPQRVSEIKGRLKGGKQLRKRTAATLPLLHRWEKDKYKLGIINILFV